MTIVTSLLSSSVEGTVGNPIWILGSSLAFVQISSTGTPDLITIKLEGSVDGVHWNTINSISGEEIPADATGAIAQLSLGGYVYLRCTLMHLVGGTSPTAIVLLSSGGTNTFVGQMFANKVSTGASAEYWVFGSKEGTLQVSTTGSPTSAIVAVEGSIDAVHWTELASHDWPSGGITEFDVNNMLYIRANLKTLSGGSSPTVTAAVSIL